MEKSIGKLITYLSRCIQQELKNVVVPFDISVGEEPITWHLQNRMD